MENQGDCFHGHGLALAEGLAERRSGAYVVGNHGRVVMKVVGDLEEGCDIPCFFHHDCDAVIQRSAKGSDDVRKSVLQLLLVREETPQKLPLICDGLVNQGKHIPNTPHGVVIHRQRAPSVTMAPRFVQRSCKVLEHQGRSASFHVGEAQMIHGFFGAESVHRHAEISWELDEVWSERGDRTLCPGAQTIKGCPLKLGKLLSDLHIESRVALSEHELMAISIDAAESCQSIKEGLSNLPSLKNLRFCLGNLESLEKGGHCLLVHGCNLSLGLEIVNVGDDSLGIFLCLVNPLFHFLTRLAEIVNHRLCVLDS